MNTRSDYLNNKCTHRQYYAQFVNNEVAGEVMARFGIERLLKSTDENLNDIPLYLWDTLPDVDHKQFKDLGDSYSLAGKVCIYKEAAKQIIDEHKEEA